MGVSQAATQDVELALPKQLADARDSSLADCTKLQIVYKDLKYTVKVKEKGEGVVSRLILKGVNGVIQPGKVTAVMGASGAGKVRIRKVSASISTSQTSPICLG